MREDIIKLAVMIVDLNLGNSIDEDEFIAILERHNVFLNDDGLVIDEEDD
jgi:hypothetical protein